MPRRASRFVLTLVCLAALALTGSLGAGAGLAGASSVRSLGTGERVDQTLAAGLSLSEHAALVRAGAFGPHPVRLLLLGDSITMTLSVGLRVASQPRYGVTLVSLATLGCDLDPQLDVRLQGQVGPATPGCDGWREDWPAIVAEQRPQVVALGLGRWEVVDHLYQGQWVHIGQAAWDTHLALELSQAVSILSAYGARVVLFTMPYVDPSARQPDGAPWPENEPARARAFNTLIDRVARAYPASVSVLDLNKMLSSAGRYSARVDGVAVRWPDGIHVSKAGGELLQRGILPTVARIGLVGETVARTRG